MAISIGQMGILHLIKEKYPNALRLSIQSFAIFSKLGSPNVNIVKNNINIIREKMAIKQFASILKEFNLTPDAFEPDDG